MLFRSLPPYKEAKDIMGKTVADKAIQDYWVRKGIESEILGQMARDFTAIPATSALSERVFSHGGDIVTRKRSRLSPTTLRWVICLQDWGILSDNDDLDNSEDDIAAVAITV